jgi:hypothetical protein
VVGRVLALIFLGLALVFCVALAASESLTNRTGRTATAVAVTFSEQVRITSYDETVFPTKAPSSRSETFRFSGGQLENGARFSVSWTPSTAEITSTEWETTGAPSGSTGGSAPLTYDQIMAQIAHYPGPDEPLYQPKEGEQVWLTDLEGHGDIYDNDSIKINYAPGFDKSQITRIDVYRNEVKLRFVPTLFDVLTNEQMKTFDGNPEEHSPKSSHTDHAIMGYAYEVRFTTKQGSVALSPIGLVLKGGVVYSGEIWFFPGNDVWRALDTLTDEQLKASLQRVSDLFDGVVLPVTYFMLSDAATDVVAYYTQDLAVTPAWARTLRADEIRRFLRVCAEVRLPVEVRVDLWLAESYAAANGTWRGDIKPRNVSTWFSNYTAVCVEAARIAEEGGAALFCPFVEMNSLGQYPERIAEVGAAIKEVFTGQLDFDEATHVYLMGYNGYNTETRLDRNAAQLSSDYDVLGMNWWDITGLDTVPDQRLSAMVQNAVGFWKPAFALYAVRHPWVRIDFGEVGSKNYDGGVLGWNEHPETHPLDYQESSDLFAAVLATAEYYGVGRVVAWTYLLDAGPSSGPWAPGIHVLNYTPGLRILKSS